VVSTVATQQYAAQAKAAYDWMQSELSRLRAEGYVEVEPRVFEKRDDSGRLLASVALG
jgi:hypothetical protein